MKLFDERGDPYWWTIVGFFVLLAGAWPALISYMYWMERLECYYWPTHPTC